VQREATIEAAAGPNPVKADGCQAAGTSHCGGGNETEASLHQSLLFEDCQGWLFGLSAGGTSGSPLLEELAGHLAARCGLDPGAFWAEWEGLEVPEHPEEAVVAPPPREGFLVNALCLLRDAFPSSIPLQGAWLEALAWEGGMKPARKGAKQLLKRQRENYSLWVVYASLELRHGHIEEAAKVYRTALPLMPPGHEARWGLARRLAELELGIGRDSGTSEKGSGRGGEVAALLGLLCAVGAVASPELPEGGEAAVGAPAVLQGRRRFAALLDAAGGSAGTHLDRGRADLVACAAWFELLAAAGSSGTGGLAAARRVLGRWALGEGGEEDPGTSSDGGRGQGRWSAALWELPAVMAAWQVPLPPLVLAACNSPALLPSLVV